MKNYTLQEKWTQVLTVVLTDCVKGLRASPVYLFSETTDNERSVFQTGVRLLCEGKASGLFLIDDADRTNVGYPGAKRWTERLARAGVQPSSIGVIKCTGWLHTYSESLALVAHAKREGWGSLVIVAPPFHQVRAFVSIVSAMRKLDAKIRVFNQVGTTSAWSKTVRHSQGTLVRTRLDLVTEEIRRIKRYARKGDLVSVDVVLEYLAWRNTQ